MPVSLCQQFVLALDSRFWSLAGTCKRALAGSLQKRPFTKGPEKGLAKHGPQKNMKVMKAMKVKKAHLKRPSADLDLPKKDQVMSLEEKMELFKKKGNQDVSSFLDSLTKTQRESLWHKFSAARSALKDEESDELWGDIAKGKGSDPARKKLLATFLKMGGDLGVAQGAVAILQESWPLGCNWQGLVKGLPVGLCHCPTSSEVKGTQRNGFLSRLCSSALGLQNA